MSLKTKCTFHSRTPAVIGPNHVCGDAHHTLHPSLHTQKIFQFACYQRWYPFGSLFAGLHFFVLIPFFFFHYHPLSSLLNFFKFPLCHSYKVFTALLSYEMQSQTLRSSWWWKSSLHSILPDRFQEKFHAQQFMTTSIIYNMQYFCNLNHRGTWQGCRQSQKKFEENRKLDQWRDQLVLQQWLNVFMYGVLEKGKIICT